MRTKQVSALARYNTEMTQRIYRAASRMSDAERKEDRGAYFGSVHATLNHLLLVDRLWLGRIVGEPEAFDSLDQPLHADFAELRRQHLAMCDRLERWADGLNDQQLLADFEYTDMSDTKSACALWVVVTQLFNHQTHHRGQISTLLSQAGIDIGVTDFPYVLEGLVRRL